MITPKLSFITVLSILLVLFLVGCSNLPIPQESTMQSQPTAGDLRPTSRARKWPTLTRTPYFITTPTIAPTILENAIPPTLTGTIPSTFVSTLTPTSPSFFESYTLPQGVYPVLYNPDSTDPYQLLISPHGRSIPLGQVSDPKARLSPDGKRIAYLEGSFLKILNLVTGDIKTIAQPEQGVYGDWWSGGWSPDGNFLIYSIQWMDLTGEEPVFHEFPDIFVTSLLKDEYVQVTNGRFFDTNPVWSPDGQWIAFFSDRAKINSSIQGSFIGSRDIFLINGTCVQSFGSCKNAYVKELTQTGVDDIDRMAWATNSQGIAYTYTDSGSGNTDLFFVEINGNAENLTNSPDASETDFDWSPDGKKLVFKTSRYDQSEDIFTITIVDHKIFQITNTPDEEEGAPRWSPDGKYIAFSNLTDRGLYFYNLETEQISTVKPEQGKNLLLSGWVSILPEFKIGMRMIVSPVGNNVNLRSEPNIHGRVITRLLTGTQIEIIDGSVNNDGYQWWQIQTGDQQGWVVTFPSWYTLMTNAIQWEN